MTGFARTRKVTPGLYRFDAPRRSAAKSAGDAWQTARLLGSDARCEPQVRRQHADLKLAIVESYLTAFATALHPEGDGQSAVREWLSVGAAIWRALV